jgi:hypothetical protein
MWAARDDWLARGWKIGLADRSELWKFITTAEQDVPLRLAWPQVQAWAEHDRAYATAILSDPQ